MGNSTKQKYRGNAAEKLYEFQTDFSGGINQKLEDSLIKDNQAREVSNFDIISGGLLSKRKGFAPLNIKSLLASVLGGLSDEELKKIEITRTFDFFNGDDNVLCLLTSDSKIINIIFNGSSVKNITKKDLGTQNASVEIFGIKPILIYSKKINNDISNTDRAMQLDIWLHDNWESASSTSEVVKDGNISNIFSAAQKQVDESQFLTGDVAKYVYMFQNIGGGIAASFLDDFDANLYSREHYGVTEKQGDKNNLIKQENAFYFNQQSNWTNIALGKLPYMRRTIIFSLGQLLKLEDGFKYTFDEKNFELKFTVDCHVGIGYYRPNHAGGDARNNSVGIAKNFVIKGDDILPGLPAGANRDAQIRLIIRQLIEGEIFIKCSFEFRAYNTNAGGHRVTPPDYIDTDAYLINRSALDTFSKYADNKNDKLSRSLVEDKGGTIDPALEEKYRIDKKDLAAQAAGTATEDTARFTTLDGNGAEYYSEGMDYFYNPTDTISLDSGGFEMCVRKSDVELKYSYQKLDKKDSIDSNHITKYIPDAFAMQNLSYNLLTINVNDDPFKFDKADKNLVYVDQESEVPTLDGIILLNGYYSQVGILSNYKASLNVPHNDDVKAYHFGYTIMPLEQWTKVQGSPENNGEYIKQVIAPSFLNDSDGNKKTSEFSFTPQTASQYIISVFAFKIDKEIYTPMTKDNSGKLVVDATTLADPRAWLNSYVDYQNSVTEADGTTGKERGEVRIDFILATTRNINVTESFGMNQAPSEVVKNFHKTRKSISWKNQMILYGGSNTFFVSDVNNFSYFPMLNNFQIPTDSEIISMVIYFDSVIIATEREQFVLTGNSPTSFKINELNNDIGVIAEKTVKNNANFIFQLTANGIYKVKTLFNFRDRYDVEKIDEAIASSIAADKNASSAVWDNKYFVCIPTDKTIWIYYNDYKAWIKYESDLFELSDMRVIRDKLYLITKHGGNILTFSTIPSNQHGEGGYSDSDMYSFNQPVVSIYKSKEIDFGLQNHDKKFKKLHVRFADTPGKNQIYTSVWVDSKLWVKPEKETVYFDNADGHVKKSVEEVAAIETVALSIHDLPDSQYSGVRNNIGNKYDNDLDQLHEVVVAARGRQIQYQILHKQDKKLNIKNFANLLKVKKPKALRTSSRKKA